jgi:hypothetical protein
VPPEYVGGHPARRRVVGIMALNKPTPKTATQASAQAHPPAIRDKTFELWRERLDAYLAKNMAPRVLIETALREISQFRQFPTLQDIMIKSVGLAYSSDQARLDDEVRSERSLASATLAQIPPPVDDFLR